MHPHAGTGIANIKMQSGGGNIRFWIGEKDFDADLYGVALAGMQNASSCGDRHCKEQNEK
jgi:hypothetical protein